jgi:tetratricopeptide (TPR) repeat protein
MERPAARRRLSTEWVAVLCVLGAALLYRLVYLTFYARQMPYYTFPSGDSAIYLDWAHRILGGDFWGLGETFRVFYRAPLYPYLLAFSLKIFGNTLLPVYIVQFLLGTFNLFLTYVIARKLFSHRAGLIAIILAALYAPLTFKESKLVSVTLVITFLLAAAWLLVENRVQPRFSENRKPVQSPPRLRWFLAGIGFGLATIAWGGTTAIVPLLILFWLFPAVRKTLPDPKHAFRSLALVLFGWFLMVLPVTLHNVLVGNDLVLVNSNSGYTFYQGNCPTAAGMMAQPPEVYEQTYGGRYPTGIADQQVFDLRYASGKIHPLQPGKAPAAVKPSEASAFWLKRGLIWIAKNPGQFLRLEFQKLVLTLSNHEFAVNYDMNVEQHEVPVLYLLFMPFAVIFALAMVGIILVIRGASPAVRTTNDERRTTTPPVWPLYSIVISTALTLLVFYVGIRYRLPLILPLTIFAGVGIDRILGLWQKRNLAFAELGGAIVFLILSWVLCTVPLGRAYDFIPTLGYRNLGAAYHVRAHDPGRAEKAYDKGVAIFEANDYFGRTPIYANALSELLVLRGNARFDRQEYDSAFADYRRALAATPQKAEPISKLALGYFARATRTATPGPPPTRGLLDTALFYANEWQQADSMNPQARALLGGVYLARGDSDLALQSCRQVVQIDSLFLPAHLMMGGLFLAKGDTARALLSYQWAARSDSFDLRPPVKLGSIYAAQGKNAQAAATFKSATERVERDPKYRQVLLKSPIAGAYVDLKFYLARAYLTLRQYDAAILQAQDVLALAPGHKGAQQLLQIARNRAVPGKTP